MRDRLRVGGIVLCGGRSDRMGLPKATLPFGPELMLQRVVRLLSEVVQPIVVVAAAGQQLPDLPSEIIVKHDEREGHGPLEGLRIGLTSLGVHAEAAYATSCDVPLLSQAFVRQMIAALGEQDAAVPVDGEFYHPLAAVYRMHAAVTMEQLLDQGKLRTSGLFARLPTVSVPIEELRSVDPDLLTFMNVNSPSDYAKALELAGFPLDSTVNKQLGL